MLIFVEALDDFFKESHFTRNVYQSHGAFNTKFFRSFLEKIQEDREVQEAHRNGEPLALGSNMDKNTAPR